MTDYCFNFYVCKFKLNSLDLHAVDDKTNALSVPGVHVQQSSSLNGKVFMYRLYFLDV